LINSLVESIQEIVFEENQSLSSFSIAILIEFDNYSSPIIINLKSKRLVPVLLVRYSYEKKKGICSHL